MKMTQKASQPENMIWRCSSCADEEISMGNSTSQIHDLSSPPQLPWPSKLCFSLNSWSYTTCFLSGLRNQTKYGNFLGIQGFCFLGLLLLMCESFLCLCLWLLKGVASWGVLWGEEVDSKWERENDSNWFLRIPEEKCRWFCKCQLSLLEHCQECGTCH